MVVINIFYNLGIKDSSCINVRAHHPYDISNTALFYSKGHSEIIVEANPNLYKLFSKEAAEEFIKKE